MIGFAGPDHPQLLFLTVRWRYQDSKRQVSSNVQLCSLFHLVPKSSASSLIASFYMSESRTLLGRPRSLKAGRKGKGKGESWVESLHRKSGPSVPVTFCEWLHGLIITCDQPLPQRGTGQTGWLPDQGRGHPLAEMKVASQKRLPTKERQERLHIVHPLEHTSRKRV